MFSLLPFFHFASATEPLPLAAACSPEPHSTLLSPLLPTSTTDKVNQSHPPVVALSLSTMTTISEMMLIQIILFKK